MGPGTAKGMDGDSFKVAEGMIKADVHLGLSLGVSQITLLETVVISVSPLLPGVCIQPIEGATQLPGPALALQAGGPTLSVVW